VNITWKITVRYGTVHYRTVQYITAHLIGRSKRSDWTLQFSPPISFAHTHTQTKLFQYTVYTCIFSFVLVYHFSPSIDVSGRHLFPIYYQIYKQHTVFIITTYFFLICLRHCTAQHCIVLYCIVRHSTALHRTALHRTALHCTAPHCTVLYCTAPDSTALYCTVLSCTALHRTVLHCTALFYTALHCTALHCTVLYCTALFYTALHCTALYRKARHLFVLRSSESTAIHKLPTLFLKWNMYLFWIVEAYFMEYKIWFTDVTLSWPI
jgi:hypothetical protein